MNKPRLVRELALRSFDEFRDYAHKVGIGLNDEEAIQVKEMFVEVIKNIIKDE